ncbi:MAG: hypothetical protein ACOX37_10670 [Bacillota bacterium]
MQRAVTERERLAKSREQEGRVLEARYKIDLKFETTWHPFDTYNTSIGQGSNSYSVLQLANYTATSGERRAGVTGLIWWMKLSPAMGVFFTGASRKSWKRWMFLLQSMEDTRLGMLQVTQPGGTAWSLFRHFPDHIKGGGQDGNCANRPERR